MVVIVFVPDQIMLVQDAISSNVTWKVHCQAVQINAVGIK